MMDKIMEQEAENWVQGGQLNGGEGRTGGEVIDSRPYMG